MYLFEAHYYNALTGKENTRTIEFDGNNFFSNEKDCYMYAMEKAFEGKNNNEKLLSLEFISC